jgi:hypothetical protein
MNVTQLCRGAPMKRAAKMNRTGYQGLLEPRHAGQRVVALLDARTLGRGSFHRVLSVPDALGIAAC